MGNEECPQQKDDWCVWPLLFRQGLRISRQPLRNRTDRRKRQSQLLEDLGNAFEGAMALKAQQQDVPVNLFADRLRRTGNTDFQFVKQHQLPQQFVDKQSRDAIGLGYPRDRSVYPQAQKRLRGNVDAGYRVYIGPSHEFHGGQFLLFLSCCDTSTIREEEHNYKELLSGI